MRFTKGDISKFKKEIVDIFENFYNNQINDENKKLNNGYNQESEKIIFNDRYDKLIDCLDYISNNTFLIHETVGEITVNEIENEIIKQFTYIMKNQGSIRLINFLEEQEIKTQLHETFKKWKIYEGK